MKTKIKQILKTPKTVGERLRLWRKSLSLKLLDVKKIIGVSQGSLSDLENNNSLPSARTLTQLHLKTDLDIGWLLTGEDSVSRNDGKANRKPVYETAHLIALQDKNLREMVNALIQIYQEGGKSKKALLKGFLIGAAHDKKVL